MPAERRGQAIRVMVNLVNWQQEEPTGCGGGRQPSMDGTSRVTGDRHARFREGLGVKFPGPTRRCWVTGIPTATGRESHPPGAPTRPAPPVGCGAIHPVRDRQTTRPQSSEGCRARGQAGYPSRLVSATGGAEVRRLPPSCLTRPPADLAGSGGAGAPIGT
jgi:hypothetical protein